ncbi:hypothetical protein Taro_035760, partial [Colocasia esculenta]|nr:hypothetical protein [Colocasia esculenta]
LETPVGPEGFEEEGGRGAPKEEKNLAGLEERKDMVGREGPKRRVRSVGRKMERCRVGHKKEMAVCSGGQNATGFPVTFRTQQGVGRNGPENSACRAVASSVGVSSDSGNSLGIYLKEGVGSSTGRVGSNNRGIVPKDCVALVMERGTTPWSGKVHNNSVRGRESLEGEIPYEYFDLNLVGNDYDWHMIKRPLDGQDWREGLPLSECAWYFDNDRHARDVFLDFEEHARSRGFLLLTLLVAP